VTIADGGLVGAIGGVIAALAGTATLLTTIKRFRLKLRATIDARRQAIRLEVASKGRASGWIRDVVAIDGNLRVLDVAFAGLTDEAFKAAELPGHSSWELIINALPSNGPFP
jgi:hypothetical protein